MGAGRRRRADRADAARLPARRERHDARDPAPALEGTGAVHGEPPRAAAFHRPAACAARVAFRAQPGGRRRGADAADTRIRRVHGDLPHDDRGAPAGGQAARAAPDPGREGRAGGPPARIAEGRGVHAARDAPYARGRAAQAGPAGAREPRPARVPAAAHCRGGRGHYGRKQDPQRPRSADRDRRPLVCAGGRDRHRPVPRSRRGRANAGAKRQARGTRHGRQRGARRRLRPVARRERGGKDALCGEDSPRAGRKHAAARVRAAARPSLRPNRRARRIAALDRRGGGRGLGGAGNRGGGSRRRDPRALLVDIQQRTAAVRRDRARRAPGSAQPEARRRVACCSPISRTSWAGRCAPGAYRPR